MSVTEALTRAKFLEWHDAKQRELNMSESPKVWVIAFLPDGKNIIKKRWFFQRKEDSDGHFVIREVLLAAKELDQSPDDKYDKMFFLVASCITLQALLSFKIIKGFGMERFNVKNDFINEYL